MTGKRLVVNRGEIAFSSARILLAHISSCVALCVYHPPSRTGGMTHIANSRQDDTTPSGRYLRKSGYFYADEAIPGILTLFRRECGVLDEGALKVVIAGGLAEEGPIVEALHLLARRSFDVIGFDVMENRYRTIVFDPGKGTVEIQRREPFTGDDTTRVYSFF